MPVNTKYRKVRDIQSIIKGTLTARAFTCVITDTSSFSISDSRSS